MKTIGPISISLFLMIALMSGGLLHAAIPHSHGDDHAGGQNHESAEWTDLHGALSHEDKKILSAAVSFPILVMFAIIVSIMMTSLCTAFLRRYARVAKARDPNAGELLRRGIHKYRAFA